MKKLFLGLLTLFAFSAFSTVAMATPTSDSSYLQTLNGDEKCGSEKCGAGKCGSGKCGGQ